MEVLESITFLLFTVFAIGAAYYTYRLLIVSNIWKRPWYWFLLAVLLLSVSRSSFFLFLIRSDLPDTTLTVLLHLVFPSLGAFCLMMAIRALYKMFYRYMNVEYLRREMERLNVTLRDKKNKL